MFSVGGEKQWDRGARAAFKGVQLIKNRTGTQTRRKTPLPASAHTGPRARAQIAPHTVWSHIVYKWSRDGQVVIIHNKRSHLCKPASLRFATLWFVCVRFFFFYVRVCVGVHKYSHHAPIYTYSRWLRRTCRSIYDSPEAALKSLNWGSHEWRFCKRRRCG